MERALSLAGIIAELQKRIETCESYKKKLLSYIHQIKDKCINREITYSEYEDFLNQKLKGRTIHEWLEYYDSYIKNCKRKIKEQKTKKIKKSLLIGFYALFVISLFIIGFYARPTIIGFVIKEKPQEFIQELNLEFSETTEYELELEHFGLLESLKISGSIENFEEGKVKIYLDNLLILDSSKIKEKAKPGITGFAIEEAPVQESPFQEEPLPVSNITEANQTHTTENQTEPTMPLEITEIATEITENITEESTTQTEQTIQPAEPTENITKTITEFSDICEETCAGLNLNKSSYTLKIEITNAKLFLEKIKYEILPTEIEIPEINITEETIQEPAEINKPVKWTAKIKTKSLEEAERNLPEEATIISSQEVKPEMFEINYETPAPETTEEQISETEKRVSVTGPDLNYTNILISTEISETVKTEDKKRIKVYWLENDSFIDFNTKDADNNNLIDEIEFVSPSTEQTYDIIIEISKAEHLDENRNFLSDIYEQVYQLDDIWSEEIPDTHYVRVTFKQNLTSKNDITIFPRIVSGNPIIKVYEINKNNLIAEFSQLNSEEYNKVYLTNLIGQQDTFDLRILNGIIEINHIIDPVITLTVNATRVDVVSNDLVATTCTASNVNDDDTLYCGDNLNIDEAESGSTNSTHLFDVPSTATVNNNTVCIRLFCSTKLGDNTGDSVKFLVGENSSTTWIYTQLAECTGITTGCYQTEATYCYEITSTHSNPQNASNLQISVLIYQSDADANQDCSINQMYVELNYTEADITAPTLTINYPENTTYNTNVNEINFTASDETELSACWYSTDDGDTNSTPTPEACYSNFTSVTSSEGSNNFTVWANDTSNNEQTASVVFAKDTTPPLLTIESPANKTYNTVSTDFNITGNEDLSWCNFSLNNWANQEEMTSFNATYFNYTNESMAEEQFTAKFNCSDIAGNLNDTEQITFIINTTAFVLLQLTSENTIADLGVGVTDGNAASIHRFNISGLPSGMTIADAIFCSYITTVTGTVNANSRISRINDTWDETYDASVSNDLSITNESDVNITSITASTWTCANVTDIIITDYAEENESTRIFFALLNYIPVNWDISGNTATTRVGVDWVGIDENYLTINHRTAASDQPYLNITYANITAPTNQAPQIINVWNETLTGALATPTENSYTLTEFNFTAYDADGVSNINNASAKANFTREGEETRANSTCAAITGENTDNEQNFSCLIEMWYFDAPGDWNITAYIEDNSAESAINDSTIFKYIQLQAIVISPNSFTFDVNMGAENQTATDDPTIINNTGNANITEGNVQIQGINLYGATSDFIDVGNFSSDIDTGGSCSGATCVECDGPLLSNGTFIGITNAFLARGNLSAGEAQEQLYYCILKVPSNLPSQSYSTQEAGSSSWIIKIVVAMALISIPRKKKKSKLAKDDKLMKALELITDELKEKYSLDDKELFERIIEKLKEKYKISKKQISELIKSKEEIIIPSGIFFRELGALESLVKYMKENLNMSYHEIASILSRDDRTIWTSYNKAVKKQTSKLKIKETGIFLPISIFKNRNFTILESAILYLKQKGLKHKDIAKLLERDPRNISTIYSRAVRKIRRKI